MSKELNAFNGICCNTNQNYPDFVKQRLTVEDGLKVLELIKKCVGVDMILFNAQEYGLPKEKMNLLKKVLL